MNIVAWVIVGGLIGWAASLMWHDLEGIVVNVIVSVVGAFIGGWLLAPAGDVSLFGIAVSLLGAVAMLALVNLVRLGAR